MSDPKPIVGVVGASARAAVHSLYRAGYPAWAVDLFTDRDLFAPSARCPQSRYPRGMPALAEPFFPGPVVYCGGLENHPDVVAELAARRPLWGNPPAVLERVRDPFFFGEVWKSGVGDCVLIPGMLGAGEDLGLGSWLCKPRSRAGGDGIFFHTAGDMPLDPSAYYVQEYIHGKPMSAVFVAGETTQLLGVTEQLVGEMWLHAPRFAWAGNIGPVELPPATADTLARFGAALAWAGGLVGLFGIDFILDADGVAWPVEVNPRYPASAEVIEHATGRAVMLDHAAAFGENSGTRSANKSVGSSPPFPPREGGPGGLGGSGLRQAPTGADVVNPSPPPPPPGGEGVPAQLALPTLGSRGAGLSALRRNPRHPVVGKAVYYTPRRLTFPAAGPWDDWERPFDPWTLPAFADVPARGSTIEPGWPVLTMLEGGSSLAEVRARLQSRAAELDRLFAAEQTP